MFDSHAHVAFEQFDDDRKAVIARAATANVSWLEVGTDLKQSRRAVELAREHDNVWATTGVHPSDVMSLGESDWPALERLLDDDKVVAVGEVGFDFYRGGILDEQLAALRRFVKLATARNLPMVFHVRDSDKVSAHDELIALLRSLSGSQRPRGVIHTFSGDEQQADQYLDLGMYLSFSGVITFKNAGEITEVAKTAPLERILIETDCPYLTPEPYRSKRNEPANVRFVAEKIAALRGVSFSEIERATELNAQQLFSIRPH